MTKKTTCHGIDLLHVMHIDALVLFMIYKQNLNSPLCWGTLRPMISLISLKFFSLQRVNSSLVAFISVNLNDL